MKNEMRELRGKLLKNEGGKGESGGGVGDNSCAGE